jgi:hypothetical protein
MSKFKQVLKEWQNKISEASNNTMRIEDDYGEFMFPPGVSDRVPGDINDPKNPVFYAIGDVGFTITDDSDYDRETGYGQMDIFNIDYVDVERIEYMDRSNNSIPIQADQLTEDELNFVKDVLTNVANERYESGNIDLE